MNTPHGLTYKAHTHENIQMNDADDDDEIDAAGGDDDTFSPFVSLTSIFFSTPAFSLCCPIFYSPFFFSFVIFVHQTPKQQKKGIDHSLYFYTYTNTGLKIETLFFSLHKSLDLL